MSKNKFVAIRNQADSTTLELYFLDVIQDTYDWWTGMEFSKVQEIIDKVNAYRPSKILCYIDSVGGNAQVGLSIYNFLKRYNVKVEVEIIGLAGSIASVVAMAANKGKLRIAKNAFMMIHKAQGVVCGNSDEIRQGADLVDLYTTQCVDIYSQRTGKTVDEINTLIANGDYWMAGEDAVAQGFCDETFNDVAPNLQIAARLDPDVYKNIPAQFRAQLKPLAEPAADDQKTFFQNQFVEMKKFFTEIVNSIKGVKPEEGKIITNQIADAVTLPFEKLADEIENTITNQVTEVVGGKTVNEAIQLQVTNALTASLEPAVNKAVETATSALTTRMTGLEEINATLVQRNKDLETEITNMKGGKSTPSTGDANAPQPVGKFH